MSIKSDHTDNELKIAFGKRLRELRKATGHSQSFVAGHIGIDTNYLSQIELGRKNPSMAVLVKIKKYFNVSIDELIADNYSTEDSKLKVELQHAIASANETLSYLHKAIEMTS